MGTKLGAVGLVLLAIAALWWSTTRDDPVPAGGTTRPPAASAATELSENPVPAPPAATAAEPPAMTRTAASEPAAIRVRGRVRDDRGPVAGASVRWFAAPRRPDDAPLGTATTDADGMFRGEARLGPEGKFVAIAAAEGHMDATDEGVAKGRDLVLRMERLVTICGRVCERGTGAPIAGVAVSDRRRSTSTDADGRYTLRTSIAFRGVQLLARAPGFAEQAADLTTHDAHAERDFALHRACRSELPGRRSRR